MSRRYTAETLVADAAADDPGVVGRLVQRHPALERLGDPVLRANVGRLVTFEDIARIAGVPTDSVLATANGDDADEAAAPPLQVEAAGTADAPPAGVSYLDVRVLLAQGDAPLGAVLRAAADVPEGGTLVIDAPFDPAPLRRVLNDKGFSDHATNLAPGHWRIVFRRGGGDPQPAEPAAPGTARIWQEPDGLHVDVRGLEPPQPMLEILGLIESGRAGETLMVHHEREPVYLYPELQERGWDYSVLQGAADEVRLRLVRRRQ